MHFNHILIIDNGVFRIDAGRRINGSVVVNTRKLRDQGSQRILVGSR
jgi:hypothetical protein